MTHQQLERRLRSEPDPLEATYVARPLDATVDAARGRTAKGSVRNATFAIAAATAVAVLTVAAAVGSGWLSPAGVPGTGSGPTATAESTPVPTQSLVRPCRASDFAVSSDPWDAGAGSRGTRVVFRAPDTLPECTITGSAHAQIVDEQGAVLVEADAAPTSPTTVVAQTQLEIGIAWSNWCGPEPSGPLQLIIRLPGDSTGVPLVQTSLGLLPPVAVPPCMGASQPTNLSVTDFQPSLRPPSEG